MKFNANVTLASITMFSIFLISSQAFAKDLGNGWTEKDFKAHYLGCIKGAVTTNLKKLVEEGKITQKTSEKDRKAIVGRLVDTYSPICKCIQNSMVEQVNIKDIKQVQNDKDFTRKISQACLQKHLK